MGWLSRSHPGVWPLTWENGMMEPFLINILFKKAYTIYSLSGMESWVRRVNGCSSIF